MCNAKAYLYRLNFTLFLESNRVVIKYGIKAETFNLKTMTTNQCILNDFMHFKVSYQNRYQFQQET